MRKSRTPYYIDEPVMSDKTLLMSVEDLISSTFGSHSTNTVNFKMMQTVLHILARQMRMLEQDVEIRFDDITDDESSTAAGVYDKERKGRGKKGRKRQPTGRERDDDTESKSSRTGGSSDRKGRKGRKGVDDDDTRRDKSAEDDDKRSGRGRSADSKGRSGDRGTDAERRGRGKEGETGSLDRQKLMTGADEDEYLDRKGRKGGRTLYVSEQERGKGATDKILVVETGPSAERTRPRVGSIDVIDASEFDLLANQVKYLNNLAVPPKPTLPDNQKLREELAKGTATLPETMQAMKLNARVDAAENALSRMASLLTQMAAMGLLPPEMSSRLTEFQAEMRKAMESGHSERTGRDDGTSMIGRFGQMGTGSSKGGIGQKVVGISLSKSSLTSRPDTFKLKSASRASEGSRPSSGTSGYSRLTGVPGDCITQADLTDIMNELRQDMTQKINEISAKALNVGEHAASMSKAIMDKLGVALTLEERINELHSLTNDYAEQLKGFDVGIATQMDSFNEQMFQMRSDLQAGLAMLSQASHDDSSVIKELTQRYEGLVAELDETRHSHNGLLMMKKSFDDELSSLIESLEVLREQKADRDEVLDGLRDKADISRLAGLLTEEAFEETKESIEQNLLQCYEKFRRQDKKWREALKDLSNIIKTKAELTQIAAFKDLATSEFTDIHEKLRKLYILLGEPKAALLARQLSENATCGACRSSAMMFPTDPLSRAPPPLPALPQRPQPQGEEPCERTLDWGPLPKPEDRSHICNRWVGGSHTLVSTDSVKREMAESFPQPEWRSRKYHGYGIDGKLYLLEEQLQPCAECNLPELYQQPDSNAAGDQDRVCHPIIRNTVSKSGDDLPLEGREQDEKHIHIVDVTDQNVL